MSTVDLVVEDMRFERRLARLAAIKEAERKHKARIENQSVLSDDESNSAMEVE